MNKIVAINKNNPNISFTLIPTYHEFKKTGESDILKKHICLIGIRDSQTNRVIIHPFSQFVLEKKNDSYSTMKNRAETIIRFLNFILSNYSNYKMCSFSELNTWHGADYLNSLIYKDVSPNYFASEEKNLLKFYIFLAKKNLLENLTLKEIQDRVNDSDGRLCKGAFEHMGISTRKKASNPLHNLERDIIPFFLNCAMKYTPRIALGVYFQIFGGLRASEVVNIKATGISINGLYASYGMSVDLKNQDFRTDIRNRRDSSVKVPRDQSIDVYGDYLPRLYKHHIESYLPSNGFDAFFVGLNGKPMTIKTYDYYFNKLKKCFINELKAVNSTILHNYAHFLEIKKWSTHIGRGTFSNVFADILDNSLQLALKRGDSNVNSSMVYIENNQKRQEQITSALNSMWNEAISNTNLYKR